MGCETTWGSSFVSCSIHFGWNKKRRPQSKDIFIFSQSSICFQLKWLVAKQSVTQISTRYNIFIMINTMYTVWESFSFSNAWSIETQQKRWQKKNRRKYCYANWVYKKTLPYHALIVIISVLGNNRIARSHQPPISYSIQIMRLFFLIVLLGFQFNKVCGCVCAVVAIACSWLHRDFLPVCLACAVRHWLPIIIQRHLVFLSNVINWKRIAIAAHKKDRFLRGFFFG